MKKQKLGYEFIPFPKTLHPLWKESTNAMLGLCLRLYALGQGKPIRVFGEWKESLCKQMDIRGRERPITYQMLLKLRADGRLGVAGDTVSVCFRPDDDLHAPVTESSAIGDAPVSDRSETGNAVDIPTESSQRNQPAASPQKREDETREEEIRSEVVCDQVSYPPHLHVIRFRRELPEAPPDLPKEETQGSIAERIVRYHRNKHHGLLRVYPSTDDRAAASKLAQWCIESAAAYEKTPAKLAQFALDEFFKNDRAAANGFPLLWVARSAIQYVGPAPGAQLPAPKPIAATRPLENSGMYRELKPLTALGGE